MGAWWLGMRPLQGAAVESGAAAVPCLREGDLVGLVLFIANNRVLTPHLLCWELLGLRARPRRTVRSCSFPWSLCSKHSQHPFVLMLLKDFVQSSAPVLGTASS